MGLASPTMSYAPKSICKPWLQEARSCFQARLQSPNDDAQLSRSPARSDGSGLSNGGGLPAKFPHRPFTSVLTPTFSALSTGCQRVVHAHVDRFSVLRSIAPSRELSRFCLGNIQLRAAGALNASRASPPAPCLTRAALTGLMQEPKYGLIQKCGQCQHCRSGDNQALS